VATATYESDWDRHAATIWHLAAHAQFPEAQPPRPLAANRRPPTNWSSLTSRKTIAKGEALKGQLPFECALEGWSPSAGVNLIQASSFRKTTMGNNIVASPRYRNLVGQLLVGC